MTDERRYWAVAVGRDSFFWDYCKKGSFIAIGWNGLTNLNSVQSLDDLKTRFVDARWGNNRQAGQNCSQIWNFAKIMKKNDIVVVRKGQKIILGIGEITSDYYLDSTKLPLSAKKQYGNLSKKDYSNIRDVKWIENFTLEGLQIPKQGSWLKAVMPMKKDDFDTFLTYKKV